MYHALKTDICMLVWIGQTDLEISAPLTSKNVQVTDYILCYTHKFLVLYRSPGYQTSVESTGFSI